MKEINELVRDFDSRVTLSADKLYERFGLENGKEYLQPYYENIEIRRYEENAFWWTVRNRWWTMCCPAMEIRTSIFWNGIRNSGTM